MDFSAIMSMAQLNAKSNKQKSKSNRDQVDKSLVDNIKAFKAKKEAEEKQKKKDEYDKKQNLLALRAQDKKSQKAANAMVKMTKSANRAAISDAKNGRDTEATLAGRFQCDSDDYGYESSAANSIYEKLMKKYEASPEDPMAKFKRPKPKLKDPNDTKFQPFRRPDSSKKDSSSSSGSSDSSKKSNSTGRSCDTKNTLKSETKAFPLVDKSAFKGNALNKNKNIKAPPPMSFSELLKVAKDKSKTPQKLPKDLKNTSLKEAEFDRPMTQKEKEEYIRERNSQLRKDGKLPRNEASKKGPEYHPAVVSNKPASKSEPPKGPKANSVQKQPQQPSSSKGPCKENNFKQPCQKPFKRDMDSVESRSFPGEIKAKKSRDRSPSPLRKRPKSSKGSYNRIESDEDEYDSEMDDFIDDSDAKIDVSAEIAKMFGYDRRKYRDEDFDDRSMENNRFADIMKEEARSARIGRMEDEEDMRREEEEKRRKMMRKKHKF